MADDTIVRDNPYPDQAAPVTQPSIAPVDIQGNPPTQTSLAQIGQGAPAPATTPLSTSDFVKNQIKSIEERKYLTSQLAEQQGQGQEAESKISNDAAAENLKNQQESQAALKKAMTDANIRDAALRLQIQQAAAKEPDPDRWWHTRSTAGKISAGVGLLLGAIGQGLSRHGEGQNTALQVIHGAIGQDIDAQKETIANNWKAISATHELDDNAFNRELHNQTWQNNYRTAGLERVKLELQGAASKTQSQVVRQNALLGIQDLSDAQDKIRNQQYVLGQQAILANLARMRKLQAQAGADVQARVDKGATQEAAEQSVYSQSNYRELMHAGMAPDSVNQAEMLKNQFQLDVAKQKHLAQTLNLTPGSPGYQALLGQVEQNPKYVPLLQSMNQGRIVPNDKDIEHRTAQDRLNFEQGKDTRERTVTINGQDYLAKDAKQAEEAATAVHSANEVKRINARIEQLQDKNLPLGPSERAELDSLLDQGALHYPRMQTGSARVNDTEIQLGKDTYQGKGDYYRGDIFGTKSGHLKTITAQADQRINDALENLQPLNKASPNNGPVKPSVAQMNQSLGATPVGK